MRSSSRNSRKPYRVLGLAAAASLLLGSAVQAACDAAVRDAQQEKAMLPSYQYWARKFENEYVAVALSNRAVLHWMSSESEAAASDLKRAEALSPKADFVTRNREALEHSHASVAQTAQVAIAPSSP